MSATVKIIWITKGLNSKEKPEKPLKWLYNNYTIIGSQEDTTYSINKVIQKIIMMELR